jgi:hypothetical protein
MAILIVHGTIHRIMEAIGYRGSFDLPKKKEREERRLEAERRGDLSDCPQPPDN